MRFDYRKYYKDYYRIDFGSDYDVHHIDFDRDNNDIANLILLPKELHERYHELVMYAKSILDGGLKTRIDMNNGQTLYYDTVKDFCEVMIEINAWKLKKLQQDLSIANREINN